MQPRREKEGRRRVRSLLARAAPLLLAAGLAASGAACSKGKDQAPAPALPPPASPPPIGFGAATTNGETALANLASRIEAEDEAVARRPDVFAFRQGLVTSLLTRMTFAGSFRDLARLDVLTAAPLKEGAGAAEAHRLRARYLGTVHEFDAAAQALEAARAQGAGDVDGERSSYALASGGDLEAVLRTREQAAAKVSSYTTLADLATAHAALGHFERADSLYRSALAQYRDVSPFPVAWIFFQRGVMWAERAERPAWARPLYEEAVRRVPGYVAANVHLAELEHEAGEHDAAVRRLRAIAGTTDDPEPAGRLAEWLRPVDAEASAAYAAQARGAYEALLAKYPRAFLDHASEFFGGAGQDPGRALALAEENLARRRDARAFLLTVEAARAAGRADRACAVARSVPAPVAAGDVRLQAARAACGAGS